jgi:hypothetical protein
VDLVPDAVNRVDVALPVVAPQSGGRSNVGPWGWERKSTSHHPRKNAGNIIVIGRCTTEMESLFEDITITLSITRKRRLTRPVLSL